MNAAHFFRQRGRHLYHDPERFGLRVLLLHCLGLIAAAQLLRQLFQLRLLLQKVAVLHQPLVIAALQLAFAHVPQPAGGGVVFRQQRLQRAAQRQALLQFRHQLLALLFQQLVVQHGGLQRQADAPALQEQGLKAVVQRMVGQIGSVHQRARLFIKRRDQLAQQLHRVVEVVIELGVVLQLALLVAVKFLRQRRRHHGLLQTLLELQFPAWQIAIQRPANGRKLFKEHRQLRRRQHADDHLLDHLAFGDRQQQIERLQTEHGYWPRICCSCCLTCSATCSRLASILARPAAGVNRQG